VPRKTIDNHSRSINFENIQEGNRFRFFTCATYTSSHDEALSLTHEQINGGDPFRAVVIEGTGTNSDATCNSDAAFTYNVMNDTSQDLVLTVNSDKSGYLFIADTWYPGWRAWVNGSEVPILRADYNFRVVSVESGQHTIRISYSPVAFTVGWIISSVGLLMLLIFCILSWKLNSIRSD